MAAIFAHFQTRLVSDGRNSRTATKPSPSFLPLLIQSPTSFQSRSKKFGLNSSHLFFLSKLTIKLIGNGVIFQSLPSYRVLFRLQRSRLLGITLLQSNLQKYSYTTLQCSTIIIQRKSNKSLMYYNRICNYRD